MSENISNEDIIPATLQPGEPVISEELAKKYKQAVIEQAEKNDNNVISSNIPKGDKSEKPSLSDVNGAIGSSGANKKDRVAPKKEKEVEKVAVFSTRNVSWSGVGKVSRGYNIITKDEAEQWLKRDHIRIATPEEVAKEFGK